MKNKALRFSKKIKIGDRFIGEGLPSYIIADIGANFDGSLEKAKKMALAAKEAGADCAKFQSFLAKKIVSGTGFSKMKLNGVHGSWGKPVDEVFKAAEFPREWHKELASYCNEIGIDFSSSPYDFDAVDLCDELNVPYIKIGSGDITWHEMLAYIARKNKPVILATGASTLAEVDEAVEIIRKNGNPDLVLLQCITNYPSKIESANILVMNTFRQAFDVLVGYSDHAPGPVVALGAIAHGAVVIEKHFTIDKNDAGPDHPHSMDAIEFKEMVQYIRQMELALGEQVKKVVDEEAETVIVQRRSLYVSTDLAEGQKIRAEDLVELRPALGILPKYKEDLIGKKVAKAITKGSPLTWDYL